MLRFEPPGVLRLGVSAGAAGQRVWCPSDGPDLLELPAGWHSLCAVGTAGSTTFYVNGRRHGTAQAQVTDAIAQLGGCSWAAATSRVHAIGSLAGVSIYGAALDAAAVRLLDAAATRALGGLEPGEAGVWAQPCATCNWGGYHR